MIFEEFLIFMLRAFSYQSLQAKTYEILNFHVLDHSGRTALFESIVFARANVKA
jgi:hypothetical protein